MAARAFRASFASLAALFLLASCDAPAPYAALDPERRTELQAWAGILARYWILEEGSPGHPGTLSRASLDSLVAFCDGEPESWPYLYACISDSVTALEPPNPSVQR